MRVAKYLEHNLLNEISPPTQVVPYHPGCELMLLVKAKQISGLRMYFLWTESPVLDEMLGM